MRTLYALALLALSLPTLAAPIAVFELPNAEAEKRFRTLSAELRCLVCQGQSLADSNSDFAYDLRSVIHGMLLEGKSDAEILDFMSARYGDSVLYDPPLKPYTLLLWGAPLLLLGAGGWLLWRTLRNPAGEGRGRAGLSDEERARLAVLLQENKQENKGEDA